MIESPTLEEGPQKRKEKKRSEDDTVRMANYTRRAASDVSQFLREGGLNSVHADEPQDDYALPDADLDMFMNREFVDFDTGLSTNFKADSPTAPKPGETVSDFGGMDFMNTGRSNSTAQTVSHSATGSCLLLRDTLAICPPRPFPSSPSSKEKAKTLELLLPYIPVCMVMRPFFFISRNIA